MPIPSLCRLDQVPTVGPRQHEVDDADVRLLEAKARKALSAVGHAKGVEAGCGEMACHPLRDDLVVFDDQDGRHTLTVS